MDRSRLPPHLSPAEADAIAELVDAARGMIGVDLERVLLYGSRARGEGNERERLDELRRRERLYAAELDRDGIPL